MKFARPQIVDHVFAGYTPAGSVCTTANITQTRVDNLVMGNGGAHTHAIYVADAANPTGILTAVPCHTLPDGAYDVNFQNSYFEMNIVNVTQVFVNIHTVALGATMTGIQGVIEFQNLDYPNFWIPSLETVARTAAFAANEFILMGVGNWSVASRQECPHYTKMRVRFHTVGGAADANTVVVASWYTNGGPSFLPDVTN